VSLAKAGKIGDDILECFIVHQVDGLDLQRLDEAFLALPAHRADEPMLCEQLAVSLAGILRTSIRYSPLAAVVAYPTCPAVRPPDGGVKKDLFPSANEERAMYR
jgi:hypothetical protein